jgi:hypothetical protein
VSYREFILIVAEERKRLVGVAYDGEGHPIERAEGADAALVLEQLKRLVLPRSREFVGFAEGIALFRAVFPQGFSDPFLQHNERNYKEVAHRKACKSLSASRLEAMIRDGDLEDVVASAARTFTNLIYPQEQMAFRALAQRDAAQIAAFAEALLELLHGDAFDAAFDRMVGLLAPVKAARWPILTYFPFIMHPERHAHLKPGIAQVCATRLGRDFRYEAAPSAAAYRRFLDFCGWVRDGIAELGPRDNIDLQTFFYVVGQTGYVDRAGAERRAWLAKPRDGETAGPPPDVMG